MIFVQTPLEGAFVVEIEALEDRRGFFARTWCEREAAALGLTVRVAQSNIAFNRRKGALRGMHFQVPPHQEARLVRCTMGSIHDVIIDLRPGSSTFLGHWSTTLSASNRRAVYVPEGFAHGLQTLEDGTEVCYQMSVPYVAEANTGVRWNDPVFGLRWPLPVADMSERDRTFPDFHPPGPFGSC